MPITPVQALDHIAELEGAPLRALFRAGRSLRQVPLRPGLYLGRNGRMVAPLRAFVRHVIKRDRFAKLIFGPWGINVRVAQDASHAPLSGAGGGLRLDLPFNVIEGNLDYGFHLLGTNFGPTNGVVQIRDFMRGIELRQFAALVGLPSPAPEHAQELMLIGYIAPLGAQALMGTPFGLVWTRDPTDAEREQATRYVKARRWCDTAASLAR